MTRSQARYQAIPPSEPDQVQSLSDAQEFGLEGSRTEVLTKWTYFLLGCAILLPWNAMMNGTSFFLTRLVDSPFHATFGSYFSSVFMLAKLSSQFYSTFTSKQSSPSHRIFASLIFTILLVVTVCLSTYIRGTPATFFLFLMLSAASLAAAVGCMCTAVYAVASLFGVSFLQAVLSGHAGVAVVISVVQLASSIISLWSTPAQVMESGSRDEQAEELAARIFFSASAIFLCITLAAYAWLRTQPFYQSITKVLEPHGQVSGNAGELTGLVADAQIDCPAEVESNVYRVMKQNWIFLFSVAYSFTVTLAVFPAVTVRVQSVNPGIHPMLFTAVHFLVYNVGDLVGRIICSLPWFIVWSAEKILVLSLSRVLFIPLILLCNTHPASTTASLVSPIINSDIIYMLILLAMGYTNGYVAATATIAASSLERNPRLEGNRKNVDTVATLCASFAIAGLTAGALCSFLVQAMV